MQGFGSPWRAEVWADKEDGEERASTGSTTSLSDADLDASASETFRLSLVAVERQTVTYDEEWEGNRQVRGNGRSEIG